MVTHNLTQNFMYPPAELICISLRKLSNSRAHHLLMYNTSYSVVLKEYSSGIKTNLYIN